METTQLYRKKPVVIEAMLFTMESKQLVHNWSREQQMNIEPSFDDNKNPVLIIPTLEGDMVCSLGDYLIKEPFPTDWRKFYPCKPDMFLKTYEPLPKEDVVSAEEVLAKHAGHYQDILIDVLLNEEAVTPQECLNAMHEYRNQPTDDRLNKAVEWCDKKIEENTVRDAPVYSEIKQSAYKQIKSFLEQLTQQP